MLDAVKTWRSEIAGLTLDDALAQLCTTSPKRPAIRTILQSMKGRRACLEQSAVLVRAGHARQGTARRPTGWIDPALRLRAVTANAGSQWLAASL